MLSVDLQSLECSLQARSRSELRMACGSGFGFVAESRQRAGLERQISLVGIDRGDLRDELCRLRLGLFELLAEARRVGLERRHDVDVSRSDERSLERTPAFGENS